MLSSTPPLFSKSRLAGDFGVRAVFVSLTYAKYATLPQKLLCLKIPQPYDFFNSKFKIQDSKLVKAESGIEPLSAFLDRADRADRAGRSNRNVAIKRG